MDIYNLSRNFFNWSFENPHKITPNHIALYFFCIEHCNRLGWKQNFGLPTTMAKEAIGIRSYNTYKKTLDELVEFGFIKMIEVSKNQYSSNIIALSKFDKALDKPLDKALIKHLTKQSESTQQSNDSIDIQYTNKQEYVAISTPTKILGFNYRPLYEDTNEEFRKMYDKVFYTSWLSINEYLDNNCKFLRMWENQITIYEFKKIYDRIQKKEISINHVRQALLDLDGSRQAKEKYNSVNHGLNTFIKTALKNV